MLDMMAESLRNTQSDAFVRVGTWSSALLHGGVPAADTHGLCR